MKRLLAALLVMGAMVGAQAQTAPAAKPDFTGNWKLNVAKSDFGPVPQPTSETDAVTQTGDDFKVAVVQVGAVGDQNYTLSLKVGGDMAPVAADAFPANAEFRLVSSKAEWAGRVLVVTQKATYQGGPVDISTRWTLSDDGKMITKTTAYSLDQGSFVTTTVFEKS
jgi:hypothetical protein